MDGGEGYSVKNSGESVLPGVAGKRLVRLVGELLRDIGRDRGSGFGRTRGKPQCTNRAALVECLRKFGKPRSMLGIDPGGDRLAKFCSESLRFGTFGMGAASGNHRTQVAKVDVVDTGFGGFRSVEPFSALKRRKQFLGMGEQRIGTDLGRLGCGSRSDLLIGDSANARNTVAQEFATKRLRKWIERFDGRIAMHSARLEPFCLGLRRSVVAGSRAIGAIALAAILRISLAPAAAAAFAVVAFAVVAFAVATRTVATSAAFTIAAIIASATALWRQLRGHQLLWTARAKNLHELRLFALLGLWRKYGDDFGAVDHRFGFDLAHITDLRSVVKE